MARPGELASTPTRRFHSEVLIYGGLAASLFLGGVIYGVWSHEPAGTILLVLTGAFSGTIAAYLAMQDRLERTTARADTVDAPPPEEDQFLPHASIWPFEMGAGMALAFTGIVLGWAILVPGVLLLLHSMIGWIAQSRRRSNR